MYPHRIRGVHLLHDVMGGIPVSFCILPERNESSGGSGRLAAGALMAQGVGKLDQLIEADRRFPHKTTPFAPRQQETFRAKDGVLSPGLSLAC